MTEQDNVKPPRIFYDNRWFTFTLSDRIERHTDAELAAMRISIAKEGIKNPIWVYRDTTLGEENCVLDGEGRLTIAHKLNREIKIRYCEARPMTTDEAEAYALEHFEDARRHRSDAAIKRRAERIKKAREAGQSYRAIARNERISSTTAHRISHSGVPPVTPERVIGLDRKSYSAVVTRDSGVPPVTPESSLHSTMPDQDLESGFDCTDEEDEEIEEGEPEEPELSKPVPCNSLIPVTRPTTLRVVQKKVSRRKVAIATAGDAQRRFLELRQRAIEFTKDINDLLNADGEYADRLRTIAGIAKIADFKGNLNGDRIKFLPLLGIPIILEMAADLAVPLNPSRVEAAYLEATGWISPRIQLFLQNKQHREQRRNEARNGRFDDNRR